MTKIQFKASGIPRVEFDLSVCAWYIRFKNAKVARTVSDDKPGVVAAIDLDERNQVIGVELLGVKEFSLNMLRKIRSIDTSRVDFDRARFVHASNRDSVPTA